LNNITEISIVSTAETALKKLKKEKIGVYNCKKDGAAFIFSVKDKDVKKVFAIFNKPCYNIKAVRKSKRTRFLSFLARRVGLVVGAATFIAVALISDAFVLKIEVSGSGNYLEHEVRRIVADEGAGEFKPYSSFNKSVATGKILALPHVTFCNIEHRGSVLIIDVQVDGENTDALNRKPLVSDVNGIVRNVVAVCGTAAVSAGDTVAAGDTLIYAHTLSGDRTIDCLAVGYAEIECTKTREFFAETESDESLQNAYSSLLLESETVLDKNYKVKPAADGVIYVIEFTYLHKLSINLS